jgi:ATP-dependent Lhr-like helicase
LSQKVAADRPLRFVGLSATLGDAGTAKRFLAPDGPERVTLLEDCGEGKELKLRVHTYIEEAPTEADAEAMEPSATDLLMAQDIVRHCRGASNLVFANSRADVEELGETCGKLGRELRLPDRFLVHHGSLSVGLRQEAEEVMKSGQVATTFCSSTLELGVDIGGVKAVGQIDPPWSVASVKQRLGRSGRRPGEAQILRQYVRLQRPGPKADLFDRLHLPLIHALAVTELLLAGWVELPEPPACDLSTLAHQVMSVIGEVGGARADALYRKLCVQGPFRDVPRPLFARLLRQLASRKIVEQMQEGDLILGSRGEAMLRHFSFYAVFPTQESYTLLHEGEVLGTIDIAPEVGQFILFAARRWEVKQVDPDNRLVLVTPARGRRRPRFAGGSGGLHPQIVAKMQEVLDGTVVPSYLDAVGGDVLTTARQVAAEAQICSRPLVALSPVRTAVMTWAGERIDLTLIALLRSMGLACKPELVGLSVEAPADRVRSVLAAVPKSVARPEDLFSHVRHECPKGKYTWLLGDELAAAQGAASAFSVSGVIAHLATRAFAQES